MSGSYVRTNNVRETAILKGVSDQQTISDNSFPVFPTATQDSFLDYNLTGDLDITNFVPVGLMEGAIVRFRKISGPGTIKYSENGVDYCYASKPGEIVTLKWYSATGFKII